MWTEHWTWTLNIEHAYISFESNGKTCLESVAAHVVSDAFAKPSNIYWVGVRLNGTK